MRLRALSDHLINQQEAERRRLARELHDDIVQRTAAIEIGLMRIGEQFDAPTAVRSELELLIDQVRHLSDALRNVSHRLYPSSLTDLGIDAAFQSLVDEHCRAGADAVLIVDGASRDVPVQVSLALYRIAQEALSNAARHAPGAPVRISLSARAKSLTLTVEDAGPGFDPVLIPASKPQFGVFRMQERARHAGGRLRLRTRPGHGTSVVVRIPLCRVQRPEVA